jgi:hypothetical protein
MASNEHPVWGSHGQEAKRGWTGGQRLLWQGEAMGRFFSHVLHRGVLERERVPERCNGLNARRMAVLWTCRTPSLCRHVRREFLRSAALDLSPIIPATACH